MTQVERTRPAIDELATGQPIYFRGVPQRAAKQWWLGTQRIRSPQETLERIRPHFRKLGLTRLADITGLDRIGIPVVLSMRPNSGYLSVDAGKGFTTIAATVSAAMECFERQAAEYVRPAEIRASYNEIAAEYATIPLERLPIAKNSLFHPNLPERWTLGEGLVSGRPIAVPTMMVTMERHRVPKSELISFQLSSNGLSSGNHFLEALVGGLYEVIERDAIACRRIAWEQGGLPIPRVDLSTVEREEVRSLVERFERAGIGVVVFDCTVDTDVPCYMAYIYDRLVPQIGIYRGYGAHLDPGIALVRAMTEAVQGRLVFISGSRDDTFRHHQRLRDDDRATIALLESIPPTVDGRTLRSAATPTFEGDARLLIEKLRRVGLDQVAVFDLTVPEFGVDVLRVIVPGLEGYMFETYAPGPRARAWLARAREPQAIAGSA